MGWCPDGELNSPWCLHSHCSSWTRLSFSLSWSKSTVSLVNGWLTFMCIPGTEGGGFFNLMSGFPLLRCQPGVPTAAQRKQTQLESGRMWVQSPAPLSGLRICFAVSCDVGHRHGSDLALLWLWCRPAAVAPIGPLTWELSYTEGAARKSRERKKKSQLIPYLLTQTESSPCFPTGSFFTVSRLRSQVPSSFTNEENSESSTQMGDETGRDSTCLSGHADRCMGTRLHILVVQVNGRSLLWVPS